MADKLWSSSVRDLLLNSGVCTLQISEINFFDVGLTHQAPLTITPLSTDGALFVDTIQKISQKAGVVNPYVSVKNWAAHGAQIVGGNQTWQFAAAGTELHYVGMLVGGPITLNVLSLNANTGIWDMRLKTISIPQDTYRDLLASAYRELAALPVPGAGRMGA